ncbi:MAG: hypothetical protein ACKVQC_08610 [Elusimicrobiota bacterium]
MQEQTPPSPFAVILEKSLEVPLEVLAQVLAKFNHEPLQDATRKANHAWGIIAENLNEIECNTLIDLLHQTNLKGIKIPQEKLPIFPPAFTFLHLSFLDSGIKGINDQGTEFSFQWDEINIISAAALKTSHEKKMTLKEGPSNTQKMLSMGIMMATGLPISIGGKTKKTEKTISQNETSFLLEVILKAPLRRLHIWADRLNYSFLKEKMVYDQLGNFKLFIKEVISKNQQAKTNKGIKILLANQPITTMGYESLTDLEQEGRWLNY